MTLPAGGADCAKSAGASTKASATRAARDMGEIVARGGGDGGIDRRLKKLHGHGTLKVRRRPSLRLLDDAFGSGAPGNSAARQSKAPHRLTAADVGHRQQNMDLWATSPGKTGKPKPPSSIPATSAIAQYLPLRDTHSRGKVNDHLRFGEILSRKVTKSSPAAGTGAAPSRTIWVASSGFP